MSACGKNNFLLWGFLYRSDVTIHSLVVVILIGAVGFLLLDVTDVVLHTLEVFLFVSLLGAANGRQTLFVLAVLIVDVTIVHGVLHAVVVAKRGRIKYVREGCGKNPATVFSLVP